LKKLLYATNHTALHLSFYLHCCIVYCLSISVLFLSSCYNTKQHRLLRKLDSSLSRQIIDSTQIAYLTNRTDSLSKADTIHIAKAADMNNQLSTLKSKTDTLHQNVLKQRTKVAHKAILKKEYLQILPTVNNLYDEVVLKATIRDSIFHQIERQFEEPNYEGEKGRLGKILKSAAKQTAKDAAKVDNIGNAKDSLRASGKVDTSTSAIVDKRLMNYKKKFDSINIEIKYLGQQLNSPVEFKNNFTLIKTRILLIDSVVNKKAASREYVMNMILEGISTPKPSLFNLAAFFGPGGYKIPEEKKKLAIQYFSPIIDSLTKFSNKYEGIYRNARIIVNGYSDATNISKASALYKMLAGYLNKTEPTKAELNAALSALRAEEIATFLLQRLKETASTFTSVDKITFEYVQAGYGEKLPDASIHNYKTNDDRRRIVIAFWSVLPIEE
jgi:outer membrane protein OmpA-like peptidoglycan-associated protein